jgi:hypothetical protein
MNWTRGKHFSPAEKRSPRPRKPSTEPVRSPLALSHWRVDPTSQAGPTSQIFFPGPKLPPETEPLPPLLLLYSSLFPTYFGSPLHLFNPQNPLCISPLLPSSETPPGYANPSPELRRTTAKFVNSDAPRWPRRQISAPPQLLSPARTSSLFCFAPGSPRTASSSITEAARG